MPARSELTSCPANPSQPLGDTSFEPLAYFGEMIDHCYDYAEAARKAGKPIVGIMCEFTPREVILAAGAVPVCLCGGSLATMAAAEQTLPANLCPLIKSTFGYHLQGSNPFLEMADLVVAETTCDGKKKMFEHMAASRPMYVLGLPHRAESPEALDYWTAEVEKLKNHLQGRFDVAIRDDSLIAASALMNRERSLRRQLADVMAQELPPLTGRQLLEFKSIVSGIETDLLQYQKALDLLASGYCAPGSPGAKRSDDPVRILLTGVPMVHGAERVLELIESCGAVVVCMENCTGLKPILEDVALDQSDPIRAIARKYYHLPCSVMTLNSRRIESLRALVAKFRPQCVIDLVWQACLTYDVESFQVRKLVEDEFELPYLKISTDYSPSDSPRIVARVEAILEVIRS